MSHLGLLVLMLLTAWLCAAELPPTIQLEQPKEWGDARAADILAVLRSAEIELWQHCPHTRMAPLIIYRRKDYPQTDREPPEKVVRIGLATGGRLWAQFSYQFAHEFGHALAGHSEIGKPGSHMLKHDNLWLEESLCETASLFTLRRMAETWKTAAPYAHWTNYSMALADYTAERMNASAHRLPADKTFPQWFHENEPALRENAVLRDQNTIIAQQLLPLFEAEPRGWEALCYLRRGTPAPQLPLRQHLAEWERNCPLELRPFVAKIAALFK